MIPDDQPLPFAAHVSIHLPQATRSEYWNIDKVMRHLVAIMWGERSKLQDTKLYDYWILKEVKQGEDYTNSICGLEEFGQNRLAFYELWDAVRAGILDIEYEDAKGNPKTIPPSHWEALSKQEVEDYFAHGAPFTLVGNDAKLGEDDCPFLFRPKQVENWLRKFTSSHVLPDPLRRDPEYLPGELYVSLCELVFWLADGESRLGSELVPGQVEHLEDFLLYVRDYGNGSLTTAKEREFERFIAVAVALNHRVDSVVREVAEAIDAKSLTAYGVFADEEGSSANFQAIPRDVFGPGLALVPIHDQISADYELSYSDWRVARAAGRWEVVKFRRAQIVERFGRVDNSEEETYPPSNAPLKIGRPFKYDWDSAKEHFDHLWDEHGALSADDPEWSQQSHVESAMSNWFMDRMGNHPAASTIRMHVKKWIVAKRGQEERPA